MLANINQLSSLSDQSDLYHHFTDREITDFCNSWLEIARDDNSNTSVKLKLFQKTERFKNALDSKMSNALRLKHGTEEAIEFAEKFSRCFDAFNHFQSKLIAKWISLNTFKIRRNSMGAYGSLYHLFNVIDRINKCKITFDPKVINHHYFDWNILDSKESGLNYIGCLASTLLYKNDLAFNGFKHEVPLFSDEIMKQIVVHLVRKNLPEDIPSLMRVSTKMRQLAAQEHRCRLIDLKISNADQAIEYAKAFGSGLSYIDISTITFSSDKLKKILKYLPNLNAFSAIWCELDLEAAKVIADSKILDKLEELNLDHNKIGDEGVEAIFNPQAKTCNLLKLYLRQNIIGDEGVKKIALAIAPDKLIELDLSDNRIGFGGINAIVASKKLKALQMLYLGNNQFGAYGVELIAASKQWEGLEMLVLKDNGIGDKGVEAIFASKNFPKLRELNLSMIDIGEKGVRAILDCINLTGLQMLRLNDGLGSHNLMSNDNFKKWISAIRNSKKIQKIQLHY